MKSNEIKQNEMKWMLRVMNIIYKMVKHGDMLL